MHAEHHHCGRYFGPLPMSHAPALLSGIFIPVLQSTNRLWLAAAGTARLHTRIRAGASWKLCPTGTDQLQSAAPWREQGEGQPQPGYKFRQLSVMQACYLKLSETRPRGDGYYACHCEWDRLYTGWQWWDQSSSDLLETTDLQYIEDYTVTIYSMADLPGLHLCTMERRWKL